MKKNYSYEQKMHALRGFTQLNITQRKHFSTSQKSTITRYFNVLVKKHYINNETLKQEVKFLRGRKNKLAGAPLLAGDFIPHAKPTDRVRRGKNIIYTYGQYTNERFIPFNVLEYITGDGVNDQALTNDLNYILNKLDIDLKDYFKLNFNTGYFYGERRRDGGGLAVGAFGNTPNRIKDIAYRIIALTSLATTKYEKFPAWIIGITFVKFTNQQPATPKIKKIIKNGKRKGVIKK